MVYIARLWLCTLRRTITDICFLQSLPTNMTMGRHTPRNKSLGGGVNRYSKTRMFAKKALYKRKRVVTKIEKKRDSVTKIKQIGGEKNGGSRKVRIVKLVSV